MTVQVVGGAEAVRLIEGHPFPIGLLVRLVSGEGPVMTVVGLAGAETAAKQIQHIAQVFWTDKNDVPQTCQLPVEALARADQ